MVNKVLSWPSSPKLARGVDPVVATQDDLLKDMGLIHEDVKREVRKAPRTASTSNKQSPTSLPRPRRRRERMAWTRPTFLPSRLPRGKHPLLSAPDQLAQNRVLNRASLWNGSGLLLFLFCRAVCLCFPIFRGLGLSKHGG